MTAQVNDALENRRRQLGAVLYRLTDDGREIAVVPQLFDWLLTHGEFGDPGWDQAWRFATLQDAAAAFARWQDDVEPEGWTRHHPSNRRRPDGDATREYVRP